MNGPGFFTRWWSELAVGSVTVVLLVMGVTRVEWRLNDDWWVLGAAGLVGVMLAVGALEVLERAATPAAPLPLPVPVQSILPPPTPIAVVAPSTGRTATVGFASFTSPKIGSSIDENEDSFAINEQRRVIVVSDGASSSFGAAVWSKALTSAVAGRQQPLTLASMVEDATAAAKRWEAHHTQGEVAWWAREGLKRGAFATLLAVSISEVPGGAQWSAIGVGDSCVLHLRPTNDGWVMLKSFPVNSAADFGSHPDLLASVNVGAATFVTSNGMLAIDDVLVVATDAVSEWLLTEPRRLAIAAESPIDQLVRDVEAARHDRSMVNDDATFVRYRHA